MRDRIFAPSQNVNYINNTVNVTNITVQNNVVYNYGPDYDLLSSRSSRPIQRLTLVHQQSGNLSAAAKSGALTKVQGDKLLVGAPTKISKSAPGIAPPKIKTKVAQPKIEKGWTGVANAAQLKEKIKTENPKNIPPPTGAPTTGRAAAGAPAPSPAIGASPAATGGAPTSPMPRGRPGRAQPSLTATPAGSPGGVSPTPFERGRGRLGRAQPSLTGTPAGSPASISPAPFERGRGRPAGRPQPGVTTTPAGAASPAIEGALTPTERGKPPRGRFETSPTPGQPSGPPTQPEQGRHKQRGPEQTGTPPVTGAAPYEGRGRGRAAEQTGTPPATGVTPEGRGGRQGGQGAYGQPGGAPGGGPPAGPERGQGKPEGGKKKGEKPSPSPAGPPPR